MADAETVRSVLARMVKEKLGTFRVQSIEIKEDPDDSSLLLVSVVYDVSDKVDGKKVSGFLRSLRPELSEAGEDRFPVISFVAKSDSEYLAGAA